MELKREESPSLSQLGLWQGKILEDYQQQTQLQARNLLIRFQLKLANLRPEDNDSYAKIMQEFYQLTRKSLNSVPILDAIFDFRECVERNIRYIECPEALYTLFKFYQHDADFLIGRSSTTMGFQILLRAFDLGSKKAAQELMQYVLTGEYFVLDRAWIAWIVEEMRQEKSALFSLEHPTKKDLETGVSLLRLLETLSRLAEFDFVLEDFPEPGTTSYSRFLMLILKNLNPDKELPRLISNDRPRILQLDYRLDSILASNTSFPGDALKYIVEDYFVSPLFNVDASLSAFEAKIMDNLQQITDVDGLTCFYYGFKRKGACVSEVFTVLERLAELDVVWVREEMSLLYPGDLLGSLRI